MSKLFGTIAMSGRFLSALLDALIGDDFFMSRRGMYKFARRLQMGESQLDAVLRNLRKQGFIQKVGNDQYLITPKARRHKKILDAEETEWDQKGWDGKWKIVIFDIPEKQKYMRNIFRGFLKRKGFIRLQNSVFVSPYMNYEILDFVRRELKISRYVNFLEAKSADIEDDSKLRKKFDL